MGQDQFAVAPASLNGSASKLLELAGLLQAGHPELEMTARVKDPAAPGELGAATRNFAEFAHDQYQDLVALLAALSTRLSAVEQHYTRAEGAAAQLMDDFLANSFFQLGER
jgi:hypothetical protein